MLGKRVVTGASQLKPLNIIEFPTHINNSPSHFHNDHKDFSSLSVWSLIKGSFERFSYTNLSHHNINSNTNISTSYYQSQHTYQHIITHTYTYAYDENHPFISFQLSTYTST